MCLGRYEFVAACGYRTCFVGRKRSDITPYTSAGHYIVGNDPCVVPYRGMLLTDLFLCERRLIPPHQSPTAPASPRGEAFLTLCEQGKYHFMLWFAFAIRPHPSPSATPSPSKGKAMVRNTLILTCFLKSKLGFFEEYFLMDESLKHSLYSLQNQRKASPWGEAGAVGD